MNLSPLFSPCPPELSNPFNCDFKNRAPLRVCSITMQRTKAQLTPLKKGCRLISFAPSREPNRFLGLCATPVHHCFAERLTCTRPKQAGKKKTKRKFTPCFSIFCLQQINENIHNNYDYCGYIDLYHNPEQSFVVDCVTGLKT